MSEHIFNNAVQAAFEKEMSCYISESNRKTISRIADRRILNTLLGKKDEAPYPKLRIRKKFVYVVAAIIAAAILTVTAVSIATDGFKIFRKQDHSEILTINSSNSPKTLLELYKLKSLPNGFMPDESSISSTRASCTYINGDKWFVFSQAVKENYRQYVNTEGYDAIDISINNHYGYYIDYGDSILLTWDNGDYMLELYANLSKNKLIDLARSAEK